MYNRIRKATRKDRAWVNNLKTAICDDNPLELKKISAFVLGALRSVLGEPNFSIRAFPSATDLLTSIQKGEGYDLLILDVVMPDIDGIGLAMKIRELDELCKIVFLTFSKEFAINSYKVNAYYYLLKSNLVQELPALLQRAVAEWEALSKASILVKGKDRWTRIELRKIIYIESMNHTIYFHLKNKEVILSYSKLTTYSDTLLSDSRFIKCHKSYILNMDYVASLTSTDFVLQDGALIPISRNLYRLVKNEYFNYYFNS